MKTAEIRVRLPRRRSDDREGWLLLLAVLGMIGFAFAACGCAPNMATYYRTVATGAVSTRTAYLALDKVDQDHIAEIAGELLTDKARAKADRDAWVAKYDKARKAIEVHDDLIAGALREGPALEAAINKRGSIASWIATLAAAEVAVTKALADAGVGGR